MQALQLFIGLACTWYVLIDGADLTQMATGMNHELDTFQKYKSDITDAVTNQADPGWFSRKLQEKEMISPQTASATVNNTSLFNEDKVDRLLQAVESKLRLSLSPAEIFQEFIKILQSEPALGELVQKLQTGKCAAQLLFSIVACNSVCFRVHKTPYNIKHWLWHSPSK